jgi:nucleoside-diphosphate-sugar epimerase
VFVLPFPSQFTPFQLISCIATDTCQRVFTRPDGSEWDYVFNCGGDTRYSQDDEIYKQRSLKLSITAAKEAAKRGVKCWVEISTGAVYKSDREPSKETDKLKPWLKLAKYKLEAEEELRKIKGCVVKRKKKKERGKFMSSRCVKGQIVLIVLSPRGKIYRLNLIVVRLANVYGEYCSKVIATILCMARVYAYLKEEMKWLWTKDLRTHTVHVTDVARALWHAAEWYTHGKKNWDESIDGTPIFNLVDHGDTCTPHSSLLPLIYEIHPTHISTQGTNQTHQFQHKEPSRITFPTFLASKLASTAPSSRPLPA